MSVGRKRGVIRPRLSYAAGPSLRRSHPLPGDLHEFNPLEAEQELDQVNGRLRRDLPQWRRGAEGLQRVNRSKGSGRKVVVLRSEVTSRLVCRYRSGTARLPCSPRSFA
jgi:hypothetical protein